MQSFTMSVNAKKSLCDDTAKGPVTIIQILDTMNLTSLNLGHNHFRFEEISVLNKVLIKNQQLKFLGLQKNHIGFKEIEILAPTINTTCISWLNLDNNELGDTGAEELAKTLKNNTKLTFLNIANNAMDSLGFIALSNALKGNKTLKSLLLCGNKIEDEALKSFGPIINTTAITELDLSWNKISNQGLASLATGLQNNTQLAVLKITGNYIRTDIDPDCMVSLEIIINTSHLISLDLSFNEINMQSLANILKKNKTLRTIKLESISNSEIDSVIYSPRTTDSLKIQALIEIVTYNQTLTEIDMPNLIDINFETASALEQLVIALENNTSLIKLYLDDPDSYNYNTNTGASIRIKLKEIAALIKRNQAYANFISVLTHMIKTNSIDIEKIIPLLEILQKEKLPEAAQTKCQKLLDYSAIIQATHDGETTPTDVWQHCKKYLQISPVEYIDHHVLMEMAIYLNGKTIVVANDSQKITSETLADNQQLLIATLLLLTKIDITSVDSENFNSLLKAIFSGLCESEKIFNEINSNATKTNLSIFSIMKERYDTLFTVKQLQHYLTTLPTSDDEKKLQQWLLDLTRIVIDNDLDELYRFLSPNETNTDFLKTTKLDKVGIVELLLLEKTNPEIFNDENKANFLSTVFSLIISTTPLSDAFKNLETQTFKNFDEKYKPIKIIEIQKELKTLPIEESIQFSIYTQLKKNDGKNKLQQPIFANEREEFKKSWCVFI